MQSCKRSYQQTSSGIQVGTALSFEHISPVVLSQPLAAGSFAHMQLVYSACQKTPNAQTAGNSTVRPQS